MLTGDPKILILTFLGGIIPSLIWLWFWLKQEETKDAEPTGIITAVFIVGMASVLFVLPVQKFIQTQINDSQLEITLWATAEEIIKYLAVLVVLYKSQDLDEPIDWPIYMITAALGFAALENMLFIIKPLSLGDSIVGLLTGQLRFLGSTLLHAVTSALLGISLALSFHSGEFVKKLSLLFGLAGAVALHSVFNFFIMENDGNDFLKVFAFLWVVTIIVMLLFEKVRRMS